MKTCCASKDVEINGEEKQNGDDCSEQVVQMEVRLPLLIRPAKKIKSLTYRTLGVIKRFLLLPGDRGEGRRRVHAGLRAVQVDDAPVGRQEQR